MKVKKFIKDALRGQILRLRKDRFLAETSKIKKELKKRGLSEKKILRDFEEFRNRKSQ